MDICFWTQGEHPSIIEQAKQVLKEGQALVFPTETIYALGVNALKPECIERLFRIKEQPVHRPLSIMVRDLAMAKQVAFVNKRTEMILRALWPGPFTVVLEKRGLLPSNLTGGQNRVGLKISAHPFVQALFQAIDFPIAATSANLSNQSSFSSGRAIADFFQSRFRRPYLIIDDGPISKDLPSGVIDLSQGQAKILRLGPVNKDDLLKLLKT